MQHKTTRNSGVGFRKGFVGCLLGVLLVFLGCTSLVWAQCTPGPGRYSLPYAYTEGNPGPYLGTDVYVGMMPPGGRFGSDDCGVTYTYCSVSLWTCAYCIGCCPDFYDGYWGNGCSGDPYPYPRLGNNTYNQSWLLDDGSCFNCNFNVYNCRTSGNYDYDCDGLFDDEDPDPGNPDEDREKSLGDNQPNDSCAFRGNPINVATGNKYEEVLDLSIKTPGIPMEFRRAYNSKRVADGPLGYGWTHNFNLSLHVVEPTSPKRIKIWDADGRALYFNETGQGTNLFHGESGVKDKLKKVGDEYFLLRKKSNLTYRFDSDGQLLDISDPNGNTITLTYTVGKLTEVSNNFGKAISIQYNGSRISMVTDPKNQSITYTYSNGDLTQVSYPDQNSIKYEYRDNDHFLINKRDTDDTLIGYWEYNDWGKVTYYYSHRENGDPQGDPQEWVEFSYQYPTVTLTTSRGTTTYTTELIDGIKVIKEIEGCTVCGGNTHKKFEYTDSLDLEDFISISEGQEHKTHISYYAPDATWGDRRDIYQIQEAVGWPEARTTTYTYTHRTGEPFLLEQSTESRPSVLQPGQNKVITTAYNTQGDITSREESGYVLINDVPTLKTYTTTYEYDSPSHQLTNIYGPRENLSDDITLQYYDNVIGEGNNRGQLKAIINDLGQRISFSEYDPNGNVGKITDPNTNPNAVSFLFTYDERNRVKTITNDRTNARIQYFYTPHGKLDHIIFPEGMQVNFTYNPADKLTEIRDNLGNKIIYEYDVEGFRTREEIRDPQVTLKKYLEFVSDDFNRLQRITNPDESYTEYTYNGFGNTEVTRDPRGNTTSYVYDALDRLTTMTQTVTLSQPVQVITDYGFDSHDNLTLVTDAKHNSTEYPTDDFGRRQKTDSPDTQATSYVYDEAGNLVQKTDANGTVTNYAYDALNRLTSVQFPAYPSQNITYTYDSPSVTYGIGRLTGRTDPSGTYTFHYDAQGNLAREEKTVEGTPYTTQYAYNKDNILTSITYPTGRTITYTINGIQRVSQVSTTLNGNPEPLASSITYLPFGGLKGLTYGNNLTLVQGYNDPYQYWITSITVGSLLDRTYGHDANGNVTSIVDQIEPTGNEALEKQGAYTYFTGTNLLDQITGESPKDFGYDQNGNTTTENTRVYVYDASNQLIEVQHVANYVYNGAGQRIEKILSSETRIFHYDLKGHIIAETDQYGQMLAEYIYLNDQPLAMIRPGENVYYYHNDHLGTPQILTNASGAIAWKATYTPFGEAEILVETVENPFRLPGQYYDQETGSHYNYFRHYSPGIGRYLTPDPIGLAGGINLWLYVANSPVNQIDPWGLSYVKLNFKFTSFSEFNESLSDYGLGWLPQWAKGLLYAIAVDPTASMVGGVQFQCHHIQPKYLAGDPKGPIARITTEYHQKITNLFRKMFPYGIRYPLDDPNFQQEVLRAMEELYKIYPLP